MYRKFSADHIFTGTELLPGNFVLITSKEGTVEEIIDISEAGDNIEKLSGILSPGFINAHCHLELSHMKGFIPQHTGLVDFVLKVIFDRHFSKIDIYNAIETAENEMLQNGIVAVGDICNTAFTIPQKSKLNLHYHNFIEVSGFTAAVAATRFEKSLEFYNQFKTVSQSNSIVPHAPYSVSPELFNSINEFGNKILTIHNQETTAENELFINKQGDFLRMFEKMNIDTTAFIPTGKTSLQTYLPQLNNYENLVLVHNTYTKKEDIEFEKNQTSSSNKSDTIASEKDHKSQIKHHKSFYCLCPNANLYITNALPDVNLMVAENCNIVLGTDSLASNHQLSILEEIKTLHNNFSAIPVAILLQWATINGAKALQMDEVLGSFEKGKKPGIVLIENANDKNIDASSKEKRLL